jgi:hypothetical protein
MAINASFDIRGDTDKAVRRLSNFAQSQVKWATVTTLNEVGQFLLGQNQKHMRRTFEHKNAYTLNAFYLKRANKKTLTASIQRKSKPSGKHYLEVQETGGVRPRKAVETMLDYKLAYEGIVRSVTPTSRAGGSKNNILMSQVNKALAGLGKSYAETAYTKTTKKGKTKRVSGERYFLAEGRTGKNRTGGIYRVTGRGKPQKMFHIHDSLPRYKPKFGFYKNMNKLARPYFNIRFKDNLNKALASSKYNLTRT